MAVDPGLLWLFTLVNILTGVFILLFEREWMRLRKQRDIRRLRQEMLEWQFEQSLMKWNGDSEIEIKLVVVSGVNVQLSKVMN